MPRNRRKPLPSSVQIQKREEWYEVADAEYPGMKLKLWVNHPPRLRQEITKPETDEDQKREALCKIVLEHNGWLDFDGHPYPPVQTAEFWDEIPTDLALAILRLVTRTAVALPNSVLASRLN